MTDAHSLPLLSLHHLTMLSAHPLELIDAAAAGGFDYVGLRIVRPMKSDSLVDVVGNGALIRDIQQRLSDTGVRLLDIEAIWLQENSDFGELEAALDVARELGAGSVLSVGFDANQARLQDNFERLCELGARYDLDVGLEFITYCAVGTLRQAQAMVAQSAQPNARLLIDALQFFRSGATNEQLATVDRSLLRYAQLCDGPAIGPVSLDDRRREARVARLLPGEGELPLAGWLAALPAGIPLSVEAPTLKLAGLPFDEQARIVGQTTRTFLRSLPEIACSSIHTTRKDLS